MKKKWGVQNRIRKLIVEEKEITDHKKITNSIKTVYKTLFKQNVSKSDVGKQQFLNSLSYKTLANEQYDLCENKIHESELINSMNSLKKNKTPGNDGLMKEFYKTFWSELKTPLMESVNQPFHTKTLSISQRQAGIKLIEKKDQDT